MLFKQYLMRAWRSPTPFALLSSLLVVILYNRRFWSETLAVVQPRSVGDVLFIGSLFVTMTLLHAGLLLLIPGTRLLKAVLAVLLVAASVGAYFADTYGVSIDREAIRNLLETDSREVIGLLNARLFFYLLVLGVAPAVLLFRLRLTGLGFRRALVQRGAVITGVLLISAGSFAVFGSHYASFIREHKSVRYLITPANIVYAASSYLHRASFAAADARVADLESPVQRIAPPLPTRPLLLFLVIGETARSQNFQLGGYARPTNPELTRRDVYYFNNISACGTSTATSLPCMFSGFGRKAFDAGRAQRHTNLLDALAMAGFRVQWRDNNSGCKGICARVEGFTYTAAHDNTLCSDRGCFDEVMLTPLADELSRLQTDSVVVFHQAGSHGPAYSERYPKEYEIFRPVCYGNELSRCTVEEVVNAYDNSIVYTDYNLARQIDMLGAVSHSVDSVLIYVSDHGESLGEKGLYLHGAPFAFAPHQQTKIPLIVWMSEGYRKRFPVSDACIRARQDEAFNHDNLYHTVLGTLGIRSARYQAPLDMFSSCRSSARAIPHTP